jgi:hypothetical protein
MWNTPLAMGTNRGGHTYDPYNISHQSILYQPDYAIPNHPFQTLGQISEQVAIEFATAGFGEYISNLSTVRRLAGAGTRYSIRAANNTTRVGRWMSEVEYSSMTGSGRVVESRLEGVTSVSSPPNPAAWVPKGNGSPVFVEFDIPSSALRASDGVWGKIWGPNSMWGPKIGITEMPPATNIIRLKP